jgi:uncharacterized protein YukE
MPIDTRVDGDPDSIRACARWLPGRLAGGLDGCVSELGRAARDAGQGWRGAAGSAFQHRMDAAGRKTDGLRADAEQAANSFDTYADELRSAQDRMERARRIATDGGLTVTGYLIHDPGPAPRVPALPGGRPGTPAEAAAHHAGAVALAAHHLQVRAYREAEREASAARSALDAARTAGRALWASLRDKPVLQVLDLVAGTADNLLDQHRSVLQREAEFQRQQADLAEKRYLDAPGGSPDSRFHNDQAFNRRMAADEAELRARQAEYGWGTPLRVLGHGLTAAGIAYDIHEGTPAPKAIVSGLGGAWAGAEAGTAIGAAVGGPVGAVAGAGAGVVVGAVAGGAVDVAYDQAASAADDAVDKAGDVFGDVKDAAKDRIGKALGSIL